MKWPAALQSLFGNPKKETVSLLSLAIDIGYVQAAVWTLGERGKPTILKTATSVFDEDTWDARTEAGDKVLTELDTDGSVSNLHKVVLGMSSHYLNAKGDIDASVRSKLKMFCRELELNAIGFVPIREAVIHKLKQDEGIPPTVILLSLSDGKFVVSLYKIGNLIGEQSIDIDHVIPELESALKSYQVEVLPSRMLLFGGDSRKLEEIKHLLLKHPWPTRANFLHFPKIDVLPESSVIESVCFAGASEIATVMGGGDDEDGTSDGGAAGTDVKKAGAPGRTEKIASTAPETVRFVPQQTAVAEKGVEENVGEEMTVGEEEYGDNQPSGISQDADERPPEMFQEEPNVVMVSPEELGFRKEGPIRTDQKEDEGHRAKEAIGQEAREPIQKPQSFPKLSLTLPKANMNRVRDALSVLPSGGKVFPVGIIIILLFVLAGVLFWFLPSATVTILAMTKDFNESASLIVDPKATIVDPATKTIPGRTQEKIESGTKEIPVTGKKSIGDPGKGYVTLYNKTTGQQNLKKGAVFTSGTLSFTLDTDVSIASASESIGSLTFGKANGSLTAQIIGPKGNIAQNTEFASKDLGSDKVVARNDAAFTGGTSKDVTVVSRADYDMLVKTLTDELVQKAKTELSTSISGKERLVDETVKSTVTEKTLSEELDQEATTLHGKLTISITGISYNDDDIFGLFRELIASKIPSGYVMVPEKSDIKSSGAALKKDGTIQLKAVLHGIAKPVFDIQAIQKSLAGKTLTQAGEYLRTISGVGGIDVAFRFSLWKNRLPMNSHNIHVVEALLE